MWLPDFGTMMVEQSLEEVSLLILDGSIHWTRHAKFCEAQIGLNGFIIVPRNTGDKLIPVSMLAPSIATLEIPGSAWKHRDLVAEELRISKLWLRPIPERLYFDRNNLKVIPVELCSDSLELIRSTNADSLAIEKAALKRNRRAKNFSKTAN